MSQRAPETQHEREKMKNARYLTILAIIVAGLCSSYGFWCGGTPVADGPTVDGGSSAPVISTSPSRTGWQNEALAVVPFGSPPAISPPSAVWLWDVPGQSLGVGGAGNINTVISTSSFAPNVKLYDSRGLFRNVSTVYDGGVSVWPSDPLDAGCRFVATSLGDSGTCTSSASQDPAWNRTLDATTVDNTCTWRCVDTSAAGAAVPYDWTNADAATLSLVDLVGPDRPVSATSTGSLGNAYPNNLIGESMADSFVEQVGLLFGGIHGADVVGRSNAGYADNRQGGTGNMFAASLGVIDQYIKLVPQRFGAGTAFRVGGMLPVTGEADLGLSTAVAKANYTEWRSQYEAAAIAKTGQAVGSIPMFASQTGGGGLSIAIAGPVQAMLDLANEQPGLFYLVTPRFPYECAGDGTHMPSGSYRRLGIKHGQVVAQVLRGGTWVPFAPTQITSSGTTITIDFNVPSGCLAWDANQPLPHQAGVYSDTSNGGAGKGWSLCRGFEIGKAASPATVNGCHSATISACSQVTLVADSTDIGFVGYAGQGDAAAPATGNYTRNGQLVDQDPFVGFDLTTKTCNVTNGSARISCSPVSFLDYERAFYDSVAGTGFASGTVVVSRAGGTGTVDLSNTWTGSTGTASLTFHHEMRNYPAMFEVQVGTPSAIVATDFPASTAGSVSRISGTGLFGTPKVWIAGSGGGANIALLTTTKSTTSPGYIEVGGIPSLSAGNYDLKIQDPYDAIITFTNAFHAVSAATMQSIWGLALHESWKPSGIVGTTSATAWNDSSGTGCNVTPYSGATTCTITSSSSNFNSVKTITGDGSTCGMQPASGCSLANTVGDAVLYIMAGKLLNGTNARVPFAVVSGQVEFQRNGSNARAIGGGPFVTYTGTDPLNTPAAWYGYDPGGAAASSQVASVAIGQSSTDGGSSTVTFVSGSAASMNATQLTTTTLSLFSRPSASIAVNIEMAEAAVIVLPAGTTTASLASQLSATQTMFHANYGLTVSRLGVFVRWQPAALGLGLLALVGLRRRRASNDNADREEKRAA